MPAKQPLSTSYGPLQETADALPGQLAGLMQRLDPDLGEQGLAVIHELVAANQAGHVCLPLAQRAERHVLLQSHLVGKPGDYAPLIIDDAGRLYFARYWFDEQQLAGRLQALAVQSQVVSAAQVQAQLDLLFPASTASLVDYQKVAAALAVRQRFLVISGGPGTGKTTTVLRLLAMLAGLSTRPLVMGMAAPTGKAAARLTESVRAATDKLALPPHVRKQLPDTAQTLHRLIGVRPGLAAPLFHADNTLPLDLLVIDEASMIDLSLMAKTVAALPSHARLILLGDKDQLSSVEAGTVLGDLCRQVSFQPATLAWLEQATGQSLATLAGSSAYSALADSVVLLSYSHRFRADSGIGELARQVNAGDAKQALSLFNSLPFDDIALQHTYSDQALVERYQPYLDQALAGESPTAIQQAFNQFMVLAAERRQVEAINRMMGSQLEQRGIKPVSSEWYIGRPVMITENDYGLGLYNGDIGFTVQQPSGLRVVFPSAEGGWREFAPGRLPVHETVFAMTIHKSQGSEFDEIWVALPEKPSLLLNRALVYTAITRARQRCIIVGNPVVFEQAVQRAPLRFSGLADRLAGR